MSVSLCIEQSLDFETLEKTVLWAYELVPERCENSPPFTNRKSEIVKIMKNAVFLDSNNSTKTSLNPFLNNKILLFDLGRVQD